MSKLLVLVFVAIGVVMAAEEAKKEEKAAEDPKKAEKQQLAQIEALNLQNEQLTGQLAGHGYTGYGNVGHALGRNPYSLDIIGHPDVLIARLGLDPMLLGPNFRLGHTFRLEGGPFGPVGGPLNPHIGPMYGLHAKRHHSEQDAEDILNGLPVGPPAAHPYIGPNPSKLDPLNQYYFTYGPQLHPNPYIDPIHGQLFGANTIWVPRSGSLGGGSPWLAQPLGSPYGLPAHPFGLPNYPIF